MSDTDLAKRVNELEERVHYLENELELSVDERRFKRRVNRIRPHREVEVGQTDIGQYYATIEVPSSELQLAVQQVNDMDDAGWVVEDSGDETITIRVEEGLVNR